VFEVPDHKVLLVSTDIPPQPGEIEEQHIECENANMLDIHVGNKKRM
jgi:hypothetical protein